MVNRVYDSALSLTLGKIENGEGKIQAIEDALWILRYQIDDTSDFTSSPKIQEFRTRLRELLKYVHE